MLVLIAFGGLLLSMIIQILLLLKVNLPQENLSIALSTGLVVLFLARLISTKILRQKDNWFFDRCIKRVCSYRLKLLTTVIVAYGIIFAVINLICMFSKISPSMTKSDYTIASQQLFIAVFSLLLSCYMFEFMLNICYRTLHNLNRKFKIKSTMQCCEASIKSNGGCYGMAWGDDGQAREVAHSEMHGFKEGRTHRSAPYDFDRVTFGRPAGRP
ncbi:MAG: hypothetical protein ABFD91_17540 [Anaerohalosphaeraceae bacterium]